jgi:uncharacterized protein (DUF1697 family)
MQYAAFFRNLNLGRPNCPSRVQLEQAFLDAGAHAAASFLTNGTLVFAAGPRAKPEVLLRKAAKHLHVACGLVEPGFVRSVPYLAALVASAPFAGLDTRMVYECCVTFLHHDAQAPGPLPLQSKRQDLELFASTGREVFSLSRVVGNSPGSPNAFLEKLLALPATTRNWNTVSRLVAKYA